MQDVSKSYNRNQQITNGSNAILKAWLIAGTLDIVSALLYTYLKSGKNPVFVLDYITKTALGKTFLSNDFALASTGLIIHYIIAFVWTALFFWLYPKLGLLRQNKIIVAILYGAFIWVMMNLVLIPLRKMEFPEYFIIENCLINAAILMLAIGLPLTYIIGGYFTKKEKLNGNS